MAGMESLFNSFGQGSPLNFSSPSLDNPATGGDGMEAILNNPAMMSSVADALANPQMMEMMIAMNPQLGAMMTPEMRQMMSTPYFRQMLSNPALIQQMMSMRQMMGSNSGTPNFTPGNLGGFGMNAIPTLPTQAPVINPEEAYQTQLGQLREMGFYSASENVQALRANSGNVEAAIEYLLRNQFRG